MEIIPAFARSESVSVVFPWWTWATMATFLMRSRSLIILATSSATNSFLTIGNYPLPCAPRDPLQLDLLLYRVAVAVLVRGQHDLVSERVGEALPALERADQRGEGKVPQRDVEPPRGAYADGDVVAYAPVPNPGGVLYRRRVLERADQQLDGVLPGPLAEYVEGVLHGCA